MGWGNIHLQYIHLHRRIIYIYIYTVSVPDPFVLTTVVVIHGLRSKNLWFKLLSEDPNREIRLSLSAILRNHLAGCCNILQRSFESCAG